MTDDGTGLVIAFDFDGTLVDTNAVKQSAYGEVMAGLGIDAETCRQMAAVHNHEDRYGMIRRLLALRQPSEAPLEATVQRLAAAYGAICERAAIERPEMTGATMALEALSTTHRLYLNSATPEDSLQRIVAARAWTRFFAGVMGRPSSKAHNLRRLMSREAIDADAVVMVGDSTLDREAAEEVGCAFVAVFEFPPAARRAGEPWTGDLRQLPEILAPMHRPVGS